MAINARKGLLYIVGGSAFGQILAFAALPILTRLYDANDFGLFATVTAVSAIMGTAAAARFDLAILIPDGEGDAYGLAWLGLVASAATCILGLLALGLVRWLDGSATVAHRPWLWCVPVLAGVYGSFLTLNQLAVRQRRFGAVGRRNVLQASTMATMQVGAGAVSAGTGGLVWGYGFGQVIGVLTLVRGSGLRGAFRRGELGPSMLRSLATRFRRFPLVLAPAGLLNSTGLYLPVILIAVAFGPKEAGLYGLAQRLLAAPVTLVGTAVSQVFMSGFASAIRTPGESGRSRFVKATHLLLLCSVILVAVFLALSPAAVPYFFGRNWEESAIFTQAMVLGVGAQLVAAPLSPVLVLMERNSIQLAWDTARILLSCLAVLIVAHFGGNAVTAVWLLSLSSVILYSAQWGLCLHYLGRRALVQ